MAGPAMVRPVVLLLFSRTSCHGHSRTLQFLLFVYTWNPVSCHFIV